MAESDFETILLNRDKSGLLCIPSNNKKPPVILCGSLISSYNPTNIPNGMVLSDTIFHVIFRNNKQIHGLFNAEEMQEIQDVFEGKIGIGSGLAFEMIFNECPFLEEFKMILLDFFSGRKPNDIHKYLIQLLKDGRISSVITPNYDDCFDDAAQEIYGLDYSNSYISVSNEGNTTRMNELRQCSVFYIHGCVRNNDPQNLIVSMAEENEMPKWKREFLKHLLENRTLIIVGYSGLDFEICPVLCGLVGSGVFDNIIYNKFVDDDTKLSALDMIEVARQSLTYNIRKLLSYPSDSSNHERIFLSGDLFEALHRIFHDNRNTASRHSNATEFYEVVNNCIEDKTELTRMWIINLLVRMGCIRHAVKLLNYIIRVDPPSDLLETVPFLWVSAAIFYKAGSYSNSAHLYLRCIHLVDREALVHNHSASIAMQQINARSDLLECLRTGGYYIRGLFFYISMKHMYQQYMSTYSESSQLRISYANVIYREVVILRSLVHATHYCPKIISKMISSRLKEGIKIAVECGDRVLLQNYAMEQSVLASYIPLPEFDNFKEDMLINPALSLKEDRNGYDELGTLFEQIIYRRKEFLRKCNPSNRRENAITGFSQDDQRKQMYNIACISYKYGILPEAHKCLALSKKSKLTTYDQKEIGSRDIISRCQYSLPKRLLFLLRIGH
ncbi:MAG: hypothetical protein GX418_12255 [Clostridiales bacterium]|nr:hypothetical protein [Clostridiales bacterium]